MENSSSFKVYDASAGSGKTFTLVKVYLTLLFSSNKKYPFKSILAITFTNKAVGEMKNRIISYLKTFAQKEILNTKDDMFSVLVDELGFSPEQLHEESKTMLQKILHNYALFNVSTIDGFNHNLIRTFAHDLKIPVNFEVELDTISLLQKAVDQLVAFAGKDKALTETLINFALEKTDDDKNWDITRDLNAIAKLLINENHSAALKLLQKADFSDFKLFKTETFEAINQYKKIIEDATLSILETFHSNGLDAKSFSSGTLYNHFVKANSFNFTRLYDNKLEQNIKDGKLYTKTLKDDIKIIIDGLLPEIELAYQTVKKAYYQYKFHLAVYKNITPLSLLNRINQSLNEIKADENKLLISEFNSIISNEIKHQPTPFIYERLGDKYQHYFIDEFQDTSQLQWENLQPLINNTLSSKGLQNETNTAMIVGDAKQAIYRWRGGKAEQFLGLINENEPFVVKKENVALKNNYRSHKAIVNFNNNFFKYVSKQAISNSTYSNLYSNAPQGIQSKEKGCVSVSFLEYANKEEANPIYAEEILLRIKSCLDLNYNLKDICVLVRKKDEAKTIANYLGENDIRFTSSDSLLLTNAPQVIFVNSVLAYIVNPENTESKLTILKFLVSKFNVVDKHLFFKTHINLNHEDFLKSFEAYNIYFDEKQFIQLPLYELAETIVRKFKLVEHSNAYVQFYLECVLEFTQSQSGSIIEFLEYFELNENKLKIATSEDADAVKIMTIHSSKGLEFPVVIYPFVDFNIYKEINPQEWISVASNKTKKITTTLLDYTKEFEFYNTETNAINDSHKAKQELDTLNVFYVALTRASERLYILAKKDKKPNMETYQGLLYNFILQEDATIQNEETIVFGDVNQQKTKQTEASKIESNNYNTFISIPKEAHNINMLTKFGELWDTKQEEAIKRGNAIHLIMSKVISKKDLSKALNYALNTGEVNHKELKEIEPRLKELINHPKLKTYFEESMEVFNETDILSKTGEILRPDRFIINNNEVTIIDYKTGLRNPKYKEQIYSYQLALINAGYKPGKLILIYINDNITIEEV